MLVSNTNTNNPQPSTNASAVKRGAFIVMEGVDRCGKTTQCGLLLKNLLSLGVAAAAMRFPDRTTAVGQLINQYLTGDADLDDRAVHLLFSANRWEGANKLEHHLLAKGETVVCDRYAYSGVAFTSAKPRADLGGPLSLEWCRQPDMGLPAPDCVIFLDLSQEEAEQRGGYGEERYEKKELQMRVRERFDQLEKLDKADGRVPWHVVSAAQSIEEVKAEIWGIVEKTIQQVNNGKQLGKMWEGGEYQAKAKLPQEGEKENEEAQN